MKSTQRNGKIARLPRAVRDEIAFIRRAYFADVDAEPEPEIFVRKRREKAVAMAKPQVRENDPGFE
jgi:hypothetical protein